MNWLGDVDFDKELRLRVCASESFSQLLKTMVWMWCGVLLGVLSLGLSAPVNSCDSLLEPITIHHEDVSAHALKTTLYANFFCPLISLYSNAFEKKTECD